MSVRSSYNAIFKVFLIVWVCKPSLRHEGLKEKMPKSLGLTRTRLLTAACTAATGTVRSGIAFPSTSPSSCMMTRWDICWATGSRILSMVLVWNTGMVNDSYRSTRQKKGKSFQSWRSLFSPLLATAGGHAASCQSSPVGRSSLLPVSPVSSDVLDPGFRCPPVGATQIVTEGIAALRPITTTEYSCQARRCRCALTLSPQAHAHTHALFPNYVMHASGPKRKELG